MRNDSRSNLLAGIDAVILCGGLGTRLREAVPDQPKALAPIAGRPFLDILVEDLIQQGLRRLIFCVGHRKEQIIARYSERSDGEFIFSQEDRPLGTGGALKNALAARRRGPALVLNGDSHCDVDYLKFYKFHLEKSAKISLVLVGSEYRQDAGNVCLDSSGRVISFAEKSSARVGKEWFISAGIYLIEADAVDWNLMPASFSLEYHIFPKSVKKRNCFGYEVSGPLIDIGTPERYRLANMGAGSAG